jgi:hypothetical protein
MIQGSDTFLAISHQEPWAGEFCAVCCSRCTGVPPCVCWLWGKCKWGKGVRRVALLSYLPL